MNSGWVDMHDFFRNEGFDLENVFTKAEKQSV